MKWEGRREPVGTGYSFEFRIPDPRNKRLLLFVPNLYTKSKENVFIDQSYLLFLKYIIEELQGKMTKNAMYLKSDIWSSKWSLFRKALSSLFPPTHLPDKAYPQANKLTRIFLIFSHNIPCCSKILRREMV